MLEFRNVSFCYPGGTHPVLENVSFRVHAGERVALVGENGSGKTTLVKLLCGLYQPDHGQILIGGVDISTIDVATLRDVVSVVFQDYIRFDASVRDNIAFGWRNGGEDAAAIRNAAVRSGALDTIAALPRGFDQLLGRRFEGAVDLSGGQWQRIALARACLRDGRILVFDEPTAALDPRAEHEVFRQLFDLARDRIAIVVSHRLTSARVADRIIVLEGGRIVEEGAHASLMARGGQYAELFRLQTTPWREADFM